jgi:hypothetical protein
MPNNFSDDLIGCPGQVLSMAPEVQKLSLSLAPGMQQKWAFPQGQALAMRLVHLGS